MKPSVLENIEDKRERMGQKMERDREAMAMVEPFIFLYLYVVNWTIVDNLPLSLLSLLLNTLEICMQQLGVNLQQAILIISLLLMCIIGLKTFMWETVMVQIHPKRYPKHFF